MKKFALLLCSTSNQIFAVGNVLIGFKKYFSLNENEYDIIVYADTIKENDQIALKKIHNNIIIQNFNNPFSKSFLNSNPGLNWTYMAFARFEGFDLIKNYEQLLYIDTDTLIKKDIVSLLSLKDKEIYASYEHITLDEFSKKSLFVQNFKNKNYDLNKKIINSGVILFNNKIKNGKEIKK